MSPGLNYLSVLDCGFSLRLCAQNMVCSQGGGLWTPEGDFQLNTQSGELCCDKSDGNEALPAATKFHADSFPLEKL